MQPSSEIVLKPRSLGWSTVAKALHENGFAWTANGLLLSQRFKNEVTAAAVEGIATAVHDIESSAEPTYPKDHVAAMRVPKGGSSCASCKYLVGKDECSSTHYQDWNGSAKLPYPADEFCSDWWEPKEQISAAEEKGWHGVDLDGTLAEYHGFKGDSHIGKPIQGEAFEQVKKWLANGEIVKIFTARVNESNPVAEKAIKKWCKKYFGQELEVTDRKDSDMIDLLDDRVHRVRKNTGEIIAVGTSEGAEKAWDTRGRGRLTVAPEAPSKEKPVVVVFGGSFNPPHVGHNAALEKARSLLESEGYKVDNVVVAPTAPKLLQAKLGAKAYPLDDRVQMSKLTFTGPGVRVTGEPAKEAEATEGKLRRTQLANWAQKEYPDHTVVNVTGEDAAPGHPPGFPSLYAGDKGSNHEGYYYLALDRPQGSLSSSQIRQAVSEGKTPPGMTPEALGYLNKMLGLGNWTQSGVNVGVLDRPETHKEGETVPIESVFKNPAPPIAERQAIVEDFKKATKVGDIDLPVDKIIPMQKTLESARLNRIAKGIPLTTSVSPLAAFHRGDNYYLMDGHHRAGGDIMRGTKTLRVSEYAPGMGAAADDKTWWYQEYMMGVEDMEDYSTYNVEAEALWNGITLKGFSGPEEEAIRATLSRIPPELLTNVDEIVSAKELNARHGRYIPSEKKILYNPGNLVLRQRFGKGELSISHAELTLVHEVGHSVYDNLPPDWKNRWNEISGWMKGTKNEQAPAYVERRPGWEHKTSKWTHKAGAKFPRYYAEKNPDEDFADCFSFFIQNKAFQIGPEKRAYLEDLVKEYVKRYPQASIQSPIKASGTHEGAEKAWDTRGRGRKQPTGREGNYRPNSPMGRLFRDLRRNNKINLTDWRTRLGERQTNEALIRLDRHGMRTGRWRIRVPGVNNPLPLGRQRIRLARATSVIMDKAGQPVRTNLENLRPRPFVVDQGTPVVPVETRPIPSFSFVPNGPTDMVQNALRDGQWHDISELRTIALRSGSSDVETNIGRIGLRARDRGYELQRSELNGLVSVRLSSVTSPTTPASLAPTPSVQAPASTPTLATPIPSRISNPGPGVRQPVGFLTQDPSTFSSDISKVNISQQDKEKFQSDFKMDPQRYREILLKDVDKVTGISDEDKQAIRNGSLEFNSGYGGHTWQVSLHTNNSISLDRTIDLTDKSVGHSLQSMPERLQGHGIAKVLFNNSLDLYDHLGIQKVNVSAGLGGGGDVWARFGFVPTESSWNSVRATAQRRSDQSSEIPRDVKAMVNVITSSNDPRSLWVLAALTDGQGKRVGSDLLRGQHWQGVLDLNNRQQYDITRAYSGRTKRA